MGGSCSCLASSQSHIFQEEEKKEATNTFRDPLKELEEKCIHCLLERMYNGANDASKYRPGKLYSHDARPRAITVSTIRRIPLAFLLIIMTVCSTHGQTNGVADETETGDPFEAGGVPSMIQTMFPSTRPTMRVSMNLASPGNAPHPVLGDDWTKKPNPSQADWEQSVDYDLARGASESTPSPTQTPMPTMRPTPMHNFDPTEIMRGGDMTAPTEILATDPPNLTVGGGQAPPDDGGSPTDAPPVDSPTDAPTKSPTKSPTPDSTDPPTQSPTKKPTDPPTDPPTKSPTKSPTQAPPTTQPPTTQPPTTQPPTSRPPTTQPPTSRPPTTQPPTTRPPTTDPPTSSPLTSEPPSTQPPSTGPPTTRPPTTSPPGSEPTLSPTRATPVSTPTTPPPDTQPTTAAPFSGTATTAQPTTGTGTDTNSPTVAATTTGGPSGSPSSRPSPPPGAPTIAPTLSPKPSASPTGVSSAQPSAAPTTPVPLQRLQAQGIVMTLTGIEPLNLVAMSIWVDKTAAFISGAIVDEVDKQMPSEENKVGVAIDVTEQLPPHKGRRLGNSSQWDEVEITFDAVISIESRVEDHDVNGYILGAFDSAKEESDYVDNLVETRDPAFANLDSVKVSPAKSVAALEDPQKDGGKTRGTDTTTIGIIVGSSVAGLAAFGLAGYFMYSRRKRKAKLTPTSTMQDDPNDQHYGDEIEVGGRDDVSTLGDPIPPDMRNEFFGEDAAFSTTTDSLTADYDFQKVYRNPQPSVMDSHAGSDPSSFLAKDDITLEAEYQNELQTRFEVEAPSGLLGLVLETSEDGIPVVHAIKESSCLAGSVQVGDRLVCVDDEDVTSMLASSVSRLIASKKDNRVRKFAFTRPVEK